MRRLKWCMTCAAAIVVAACAPPAGKATLKGRVVLPGVADASGIPVAITGTTSVTVLTDAGGAWRAGHLRAGHYAVTAAVPSTLEGTEVTAATVPGTGTATAPTLTFAPVGTLSGTVTVAGGDPAPAGTLVVAAGTAAEAATGTDGHYTLRDVPVGPVTVLASDPAAGRGAAPDVTVAWNAAATVPDLALVPAPPGQGGITGTAVLTGLADSSQVAVTLAGPVDAATHPDAAGDFSFTGLPDGAYTLTAAADATREGTVSVPVTVAGPATPAPPLALTPVGTVSGEVSLGGATAGNAGITVLVTGPTGEAVSFTDDAGHYTVADAPVGAVTVEAAFPGYGVATTVALPVTWDTTAPAPALRLEPAGSATGSLATVQGVATPAGVADASGLTVRLLDDTGASIATATTDAAGAYTLPGVPPGLYTATFDRGAYHETVPALLAMPGTDGFVVDGGILPLAPLEVPRARRLVAAPSTAPVAITPDGGEAVVARELGGAGTCVLDTVDVATGQVREVPAPSCSANLQVSDDGTLAYAGGNASTSDPAPIYATPVAGGPSVRLLDRPLNGAFQVLPDGRHLVVATQPSNGLPYQVVLAAADGSPPEVLLAASPWYTAISIVQLSPDGSQLLVDSSGLKVITLATGAVTDLGAGGSDPRFLPGGVKVLYATSDPQSSYGVVDLQVVPASGGTPRLLASQVSQHTATPTPDGSRVLYQDASGGTPGPIDSVPVDGSAAPVTLAASAAIQAVSPDGSRVVLTRFPDRELVSVPVAGGAVADLGGQDAQRVAFSPDGTRVAWTQSCDANKACDLEVAPIAGGPPTRIATGAFQLGALVFSPDGSAVFYLTVRSFGNVHHGTLMRAATSGGPPVEVIPDAWDLRRVGDHVFARWIQGTAPYRFQEGLHALSLP